VIKVELSLKQAVAVRSALFETTKMFTYDPSCVPPRVVSIREMIVELDKQIETELEVESVTSE